MTQEELIKIVKQLNHVDLQGEAKDELTAKVLQMAADSVTLETLKGLLTPNRSNGVPVPEGEVAKTLGRKSRSGFTLTKKEIKSMPEKYRRIFACEDRIIRVQNEILTCTTSKTKMGRSEVSRSIPFTPVFRRVLPYVDFEKAKNTNVNTIYTTFKRLLPNHHTHELRYNFIQGQKKQGAIWKRSCFGRDIRSTKT